MNLRLSNGLGSPFYFSRLKYYKAYGPENCTLGESGNAMKIAAYCLFALAVVTTFVAINNIFLAAGANRPEGDVNLVSYAVGAFLMPVIFLIVGLILFNKAKKPVDKDMT